MARPYWLLLPSLLLAAVLAWLVLERPLEDMSGASPPVEELLVEDAALSPGLISLSIRGDGSEPVTIAQIQVDGAYRTFTARPSATVGRLGTATIDIPYPWIAGETLRIVLVTAIGATFEYPIDTPVAKPDWHASFGELLLVGLLVGVVPVGLGMLTYPAMRSVGPVGMTFVLALTVGVLLFLFASTLIEGLQRGAEALDRLRGTTVVFVSATITALALRATSRRGGTPPEGLTLALFIAIGIGLHNFGEGLVVGAALASAAASLATFLVFGFVVHNVTEGIAIAAPMVRTVPPSLPVLAGLVALAGAPAIAGVILGTQVESSYWIAICFGIGAGAILQVLIEVAGMMGRGAGSGVLTRPEGAGGVGVGLAVMYLTSLLV